MCAIGLLRTMKMALLTAGSAISTSARSAERSAPKGIGVGTHQASQQATADGAATDASVESVTARVGLPTAPCASLIYVRSALCRALPDIRVRSSAESHQLIVDGDVMVCVAAQSVPWSGALRTVLCVVTTSVHSAELCAARPGMHAILFQAFRHAIVGAGSVMGAPARSRVRRAVLRIAGSANLISARNAFANGDWRSVVRGSSFVSLSDDFQTLTDD